ncbi:hypothetical protein JCM8202_001213 [Rhodotorula sphaerocarpa]
MAASTSPAGFPAAAAASANANAGAGAGAGPSSRAPSRSPSIVSILNNPNDDVERYSDHDYFNTANNNDHQREQEHSGGGGRARGAEDLFARATSPSPALNAGHSAQSGHAAAPPRASHKRPRTASSGHSVASPPPSLPPATDARNLAGEADEHEGSMEPPVSKIRRSSSTASTDPALAAGGIGGPAGGVLGALQPLTAAATTTMNASPSPATTVSPATSAPDASLPSPGTSGATPSVAAGQPSPPPPPPQPATASSSSSSSRPSSRHAPPPPPPGPASAPSPAPAPNPPARRRPALSSLPLEPSIFNVAPIDEFTREVADWLWGFTQHLDWDKVEIEAKIGLLLDSRLGRAQRVQMPVPIETILMDDTGLRFDADMSDRQHLHFNHLLNARVEECADPSYPRARLRYTHTRELDSFHTVPSDVPGEPAVKVRVTRDQKDPSKVRAVQKVRVADMNIHSPKRLFDFRVSVSLEIPTPVPPTALSGPPARSRYKDRISYSHQLCQVDLTKVQTGSPTAAPTHELEVEIRNARQLLEEAAKDQRGEENRYLDMVQILLNNIRMLIRNASDP